jgi:DNA polymerase-3 subunit epsilon
MAAKSHLFMLTEAFSLCQKLCGLFDTKGACFHYNLKQCHGACIREEEPERYNDRVLQATEPYRFDRKNFLIIDKGRNDGEKSVVGFENGRYLGFGYIDFEMNGALNVDDLKGCIKKHPDNRDVQQIIRAYVKRNPSIRIVDY